MNEEKRYYYGTLGSKFGEIVFVWRFADNKVVRIFLPMQRDLFRSSEYRSWGMSGINNRAALELIRKMESLLNGNPVEVSLDIVDWTRTAAFQRLVLRTEGKIPRGMVSTYGRIALKVNRPHAARAVGRALATNPFPLIIPCHRAVRSDRSLAGYAGGVKMKKRLLELEGIEFDQKDRVVTTRFW
ncbi:MAG: methylated-DNA--[protein]-cysteine S-methyltransferase [candidate division WOR-3 bacterium]|nr:MAG: methylated-DNA--[protein]-cysteine S-methyltransferase [candidate division WOR-3 bacterium]